LLNSIPFTVIYRLTNNIHTLLYPQVYFYHNISLLYIYTKANYYNSKKKKRKKKDSNMYK